MIKFEHVSDDGFIILFDEEKGIHRKYIRLPLGNIGEKIRNLDGKAVYIKVMKIMGEEGIVDFKS